MSIISAYVHGTVSKETLVSRILPLGIGIIFSTLLVANITFPTVYDWRYIVISALIEPKHHPGWFIIPSIGMTVSGFVLIPLIGYVHKRLISTCKGTVRVGTFFMILGTIGLISLASIGHLVTGVRNFHEIVAGVAFLGFLFAAFFHGPAIMKANRAGDRRFNMKVLKVAWAFLWATLAGIGGSALYLELVGGPGWGWVGLDWIEQGVPVILSFALWEWVLLFSITTYLAALGIALPASIEPVAETTA